MASAPFFWVTRTFPGNLRTCRVLWELGHHALSVPLLQVRPVGRSAVMVEPQALAFTSSHAVRFHPFQRRWAEIPVYAVGDQTAAVVRGAGYCNVVSASGDIGALRRLIEREVPRSARLVYFSAEEPAEDVARDLRTRGYDASRVAVYETAPVGERQLARALDELPCIGGIIVHSAKAGNLAARIVEDAGWRGVVIGLSKACAASFGHLPGIEVRVAKQPTGAALLQAVRGGAPARQAPLTELLRTARHAPLVGQHTAIRIGTVANDNSARRPTSPAFFDDPDDPPPSAA